MSENHFINSYNLLSKKIIKLKKIDDSFSPQKTIYYEYNINNINYSYIGVFFGENVIKIKLGKFSYLYYSYSIANIKLKNNYV